MILQYFFKLLQSKRGSPLVEEAILMGLALFVFLLLGAIIFDLIDFASEIFNGVSEVIGDLPE